MEPVVFHTLKERFIWKISHNICGQRREGDAVFPAFNDPIVRLPLRNQLLSCDGKPPFQLGMMKRQFEEIVSKCRRSAVTHGLSTGFPTVVSFNHFKIIPD